ncbi:MAG TPA: ABC transporter substrate-binding protein, partial [Hyphomicrobiaceae bacterium]|nr:ABC transporter substrate-binding protein [Hyphomicrobiaceae bacterium]
MTKRMRAAAMLAALIAASPIAISLADAKTLRWARSQDALTLDPHAQNEGATFNLLHSIYEPMILRDRDGKLLPTLALSWGVTSDPTVWEFKLRP